jgi:hypothetical protein
MYNSPEPWIKRQWTAVILVLLKPAAEFLPLALVVGLKRKRLTLANGQRPTTSDRFSNLPTAGEIRRPGARLLSAQPRRPPETLPGSPQD